jgi:hypothetical protein
MVSSSASATTVYSSPSSFTAATTNPTNIGFNGLLPPQTLFAGYSSVTVSGIVFSTPTAGTNVNVTTANYYGAGYTYPADFIVNSYNPLNAAGNNQLNITFSTPLMAFGIYYGSMAGGHTGTFTLPDTTSYQDTSVPGLGVLAFVGFVSSTPITSVSFATAGDSWIVDSLVRATPANIVTTPEPASAALVFSAAASLLCGIALQRRKRRSRRS